MKRQVATKVSRAAAATTKGVFTSHRASFVISDDLQILPNMAGMFQIFTILGITDIDGAEPATVTIGLNEVSFLRLVALMRYIRIRKNHNKMIIGEI